MNRWKIALHFEVDAGSDDDAFHAGEDLAATIEALYNAEYGGTVVLSPVEERADRPEESRKPRREGLS